MIRKYISKIAIVLAASTALELRVGRGVSMITIFAPGGAVVGWALAGTLSSIGLTLAGCAGW